MGTAWRALACGILLASACVQPTVVRDGVPVAYDKAARADLEQARSHLTAGMPQEAVRVLERLLEEQPQGRHAGEALFLLGQAQLQLGQRERSVSVWRRLLERHPRSRRAPETSLRLAQLYQEMGRPEIARRVLDDAAVERASRELRTQLFRMGADLARSAGDYPAAVLALARARRDLADPEDAYVFDLELRELIRERLRDRELEAIVDRVPRGPVHDEILLEVARRAVARAEFGAAREALDRLPSRLRAAQEPERARLRARARTGARSVVHALGLALPLSGGYAAFGESVLRGVTLALGIFDEPPGRYRLIIRDTAGDISQGAQAVQELTQLRVRAIIGPMRSVVAAEAAPIAERAGVSLLTLAPREDIAELGDYVFRMGLTASEQVDLLADYSVGRKGYRRFAILYPRADYGRKFKNLFWEEIERRGGEVVGVEGYDPDAVDLQIEIKKLVGLHYVTPDERALIDERARLSRRSLTHQERLAEIAELELPPYVDFDALFIPDVAGKVGLILPQLRLYDVEGVEFMGTNDWNDPKLIEIAGRYASGVVFADAFYAGSADPTVADFVTRFHSRYDRTPDLFSALGFDIASILRSLIDDAGQLSPSQLQRELLQVSDFPGSSGLTSIDHAGSTRRELHLLTVQRGKILELKEDR